MPDTSNGMIEDNVFFREKVSSNRVKETHSLWAIGSTMSIYPWEKHFRCNGLSSRWLTSSGRTHALGRMEQN